MRGVKYLPGVLAGKDILQALSGLMGILRAFYSLGLFKTVQLQSN